MSADRPARGATLHLRIPGLLGPMPPDAGGLLGADPERARLAGLLSRGRRLAPRPEGDAPPGFALSGPANAGPGLPAGAVGLLGCGRDPGQSYWFRADPVHLVADRDRLRLLGPERLDLAGEEAEALVRAFNAFYAEDGLELVAPRPAHWFLRCPHPPALTTAPLEQALQAPLDGLLPSGPDGPAWQARLNEVQMLLHDHPVNQAREARGALTANGLWPWGGGVRPEVTAQWDRVLSDDPLVRGLGIAASVAVDDLPVDPVDALEAGRGERILAVTEPLPRVHDGESFAAWERGVNRIAATWAEALEAGLRRGGLGRVVIDAGAGGAWQLRRGSLAAVWRRRRTFDRFLRWQ